MKFSPITAIAALGIIALASCYPVQEPPIHQGQEKPQQMTPEQQRLKMLEEQRKRMADEALRNEQPNSGDPTTSTNTGADTNTGTGTGTTAPTTDYPFASKVPGKEGFVFSPYNKRVVDVRDIPSGTLVQDPTYPASEKKYFRVP